jgi:lipopolysaccharide/colanic/teichoic acid biosynthesis glycosyltransferase
MIGFWNYINRDWYPRTGKRLVDLAVSIVGMVVFLPFYAAITAAIWLTMGRPILFRQRRPGLNERIFTILKFRTMSQDRDGSGALLADRMRITWLGKLLRATSLDELPEFWNVFRGEMSLVGPRPQLEDYLPLLTARQKRRHEVAPGVTGLAQARGRNNTTWRRRFALDVFYVEHQSLALDLMIVAETVRAMLRGDGGATPIERLDATVNRAMQRGSF